MKFPNSITSKYQKPFCSYSFGINNYDVIVYNADSVTGVNTLYINKHAISIVFIQNLPRDRAYFGGIPKVYIL